MCRLAEGVSRAMRRLPEAEEHLANGQTVAEVGSHPTDFSATKCGGTDADIVMLAFVELGEQVTLCTVEVAVMTSIEADRRSCGKLDIIETSGTNEVQGW